LQAKARPDYGELHGPIPWCSRPAIIEESTGSRFEPKEEEAGNRRSIWESGSKHAGLF